MIELLGSLKDMEIEEIRKDLIGYKISQNIKNVIRYELDQNIKNTTVEKLTSIKKEFLRNIKQNIKYREMQFYLEVKDYTFIYTLENKNNINSEMIIELLLILKKYSNNVINKSRNININTCANIRKALIRNDLVLKSSPYLLEYISEIEAYLKKVEYDKPIIDTVMYMVSNWKDYEKDFEELIKSVASNNRINNGTYFRERGITQEHLINYSISPTITNNDKIRSTIESLTGYTLNNLSSIELVSCIGKEDVGKDDNSIYYDGNFGNWRTRRYNVINTMVDIMNMIYLNIKCDELLQDYFFINQNEILNYYKDDDSKTGYEEIYKYYLKYQEVLKADKTGTRKSKLYKTVSDIKEKLRSKLPCYTLFNINIQEINKLLNLVRDESLYEEVLSIKKELQNSQRILKSKWREFYNKLETYISLLEAKDLYYMTQLNTVKKNLFKEDKKINSAKMVKEIHDEEEIKILKAEYEALILVAKNIFELELLERKKGVGTDV